MEMWRLMWCDLWSETWNWIFAGTDYAWRKTNEKNKTTKTPNPPYFVFQAARACIQTVCRSMPAGSDGWFGRKQQHGCTSGLIGAGSVQVPCTATVWHSDHHGAELVPETRSVSSLTGSPEPRAARMKCWLRGLCKRWRCNSSLILLTWASLFLSVQVYWMGKAIFPRISG